MSPTGHKNVALAFLAVLATFNRGDDEQLLSPCGASKNIGQQKTSETLLVLVNGPGSNRDPGREEV